MIVLPATLRKQWEIELEDKFDLDSTIMWVKCSCGASRSMSGAT